jgi:glutamate/tyrosine decarboxylase-like PLP-dependent enzyme
MAMLHDTVRDSWNLKGQSLDPADSTGLRALGHRMLDDMFDNIDSIADGPVWQKMPDAMQTPLPLGPAHPVEIYGAFQRLIAPYAVGNRHPQFLGWVHGGGTAIGMLAEMLAAGLNANCGGRDHAPIAVERQVIAWAAEMLGLPPDASGLLMSGTSMANFAAILVARTTALGPSVRQHGAGSAGLVGYAAASVHLCVSRGFDMAGLGSDALRLIDCDADHRMQLNNLRQRVAADRAAGLHPFMVVGTAGTVDIGAIDDLTALADFCAAQGLWFHVDAAFAALAMLSPRLRPLLAGIERADSVAFDFHKWAQVPYDCGCLIVRDAHAHQAAFARNADYLSRAPRGLAGGNPWPVDLGPELSRGFRALKVWMTLKAYGTDKLGAVAEHCCELAQEFATCIDAEPGLERAATVPLNIVCFRVVGADDARHVDIAAAMQEAGQAVLSTTTLNGKTVLRAAFVNHRTTSADLAIVLQAVLAQSKAAC